LSRLSFIVSANNYDESQHCYSVSQAFPSSLTYRNSVVSVSVLTLQLNTQVGTGKYLTLVITVTIKLAIIAVASTHIIKVIFCNCLKVATEWEKLRVLGTREPQLGRLLRIF